MLKLLKYPFSIKKTSPAPVYLIHFVTNRCNARCPHCFVYDSEGKPTISDGEMSLNQIESLTKSIGKTIYSVNITGGETFLRDDIEEICHLYLKNTDVRILQLFTNGYFTEKTVNTVKKLCTDYPKRNFVVSISIDNLKEKHDEYRKLKNGYQKAVSTYHQLKSLQMPNLDLYAALTVSSHNQEDLMDIYSFLTEQENIDNIACTIVRGTPGDITTKDVDFRQYEQFTEQINSNLQKKSIHGLNKIQGSDLLNAKGILMREYTIPKILTEGYLSPCYAGRLSGVIYPNGDVSPCDLLNTSMGNLQDFNYSLKKLWSSPRAKEVQSSIWKDKCYCEHECFQTINILFNPRYYFRLLKIYWKIKMNKIKEKKSNRE